MKFLKNLIKNEDGYIPIPEASLEPEPNWRSMYYDMRERCHELEIQLVARDAYIDELEDRLLDYKVNQD